MTIEICKHMREHVGEAKTGQAIASPSSEGRKANIIHLAITKRFCGMKYLIVQVAPSGRPTAFGKHATVIQSMESLWEMQRAY